MAEILNSPPVIGEVIATSSSEFRAECARLDEPPEFGMFVKIHVNPVERIHADVDPFDSNSLEEGTIYAVVYEADTGSIDSGRKAVAYWKDEDSLRREQPQVFELLATEFGGLIVGHVRDGQFRPYLPPRPPRLHGWVSLCADSEVHAITGRLDILRTILSSDACKAPDELMAACLRHACPCHPEDSSFLLRAGKELARLLGDDYDRLTAIVNRLPR